MSTTQGLRRFLEIIPGFTSWGIIILMVALSIWRPVLCAALIIIFDFYWVIRTAYLTTLLIMARRKLFNQKDKDWLADCEVLGPKKDWQRLYHLIIFPVYKEGAGILSSSLEALKECHYPKEKMIVVVSFEERDSQCKEKAKILEKEFKASFLGYLSTFHPDRLPAEARAKGANATWAAKHAKEFLSTKLIPYEDVIISCFDADTCVDREYFGCLTFHFLTSPKPHQACYQPIPVYNNNIWYAPSFARLVEISA